ncbi:Metallo-beta-lactamase domain protein, partial [Trichostrongylus colubriformis]
KRPHTTLCDEFFSATVLSGEIVRSLDDWERALLRDFVRGKGRGSVSRIPVELLNEPPPSLDEAQDDDNLVSLMAPPESALRAGPMMNVPRDTLRSMTIPPKQNKKLRNSKEDRPVPSVISPASKVKRRPATMTNSTVQKRNKSELEEPTQETFKELSGLLQTFIDRRKPLLQRVTISSSTHPPSLPSTSRDEKTGDITSGTSTIGRWEAMNPEDDVEDQEELIQTSSGEPHEDWEAKMRELSGQLSSILMQIKRAKETRPVKFAPLVEKPKPKVTILRNGSANQTDDGRYNFVATITLIQDSGKNILVDTGLGTDINGRMQLMNALEKHDLVPPNIDVVVTTHGHPDHAGGVHDFPDAIHYQGWYIHHHTTFNLSNLFEVSRSLREI